jgi:hypothetical protein
LGRRCARRGRLFWRLIGFDRGFNLRGLALGFRFSTRIVLVIIVLTGEWSPTVLIGPNKAVLRLDGGYDTSTLTGWDSDRRWQLFLWDVGPKWPKSLWMCW